MPRSKYLTVQEGDFVKRGDILVDGNSLILTLSKNLSDEDNRFKRINVKKIASLNDLVNMPVNEVKIFLEGTEQLKKIEINMD